MEIPYSFNPAMKKGLEIQGGAKRGHKIKAPRGIRPTRALLKRSLFDRLGEWIVGVRMLELFAGSGAVGLEALSRGAESVVFVDNSRQSFLAIKENIDRLGYKGRAVVIKSRVDRALRDMASRGEKFDFIFADPPYKMVQLERILELVAEVLDEDGVFVLETHKKTPAPACAGLTLKKEARIGDTILRFYHRNLSGDI